MNKFMNAAEDLLNQHQQENCVGKWCVISIADKLYEATVVDCYLDKPSRPKRVRIQSKGEFQGNVVMPKAYTFKHWTENVKSDHLKQLMKEEKK